MKGREFMTVSEDAIALLLESKEEGQILCKGRLGNGGWIIGSGRWDWSVLKELVDARYVSRFRKGDYHEFTRLGKELACRLSGQSCRTQ